MGETARMQKNNKEGLNEGFRGIWKGLYRDLWIVLLDILAVNAAYFLALLVRFYVNFEFRPTVQHYIPAFLRIAPVYTLLCVIVFALFRLYNGMWRYAGLNDMNRILLASGVTCLLQVAVSLLMGSRMPITYYLIGALLQFLFVTLIRFAYRIVIVERRKINGRRLPAVRVMIVGAGEMGRRVIRHLEEDPAQAWRPVCVVDSHGAGGFSMDGIPVLDGLARVSKAAEEYKVESVLIADPGLSAQERADLRGLCQEKSLELRDFTGYLSNLGGRVPLTALLEVLQGPVTLETGEGRRSFDSSEQAALSLTGQYSVVSVSAEEGGALLIRVTDNGEETSAKNETWVRRHREETGEEISFF